MTANHDLQRRLARHFESEPPPRAPDWVLQSALSTIESTPQRRGLPVLRRYTDLSTYTKLAAAAALVVAVGGFTLWQMGQGGPGGIPAASPLPTAAPSATAAPSPTARPEPTTYVPGALTQTFISTVNGFSLKYPGGWSAGAATQTWTEGVLPHFGEPDTDNVFDTDLRDHLFVGAGSQPLGGMSLDEWQGEFFDAEGCGVYEELTVDGAPGWIGRDCDIAMIEVGGRGYIFGLWSSSDDRQLRDLDTRTLFLDVLATVELDPTSAR